MSDSYESDNLSSESSNESLPKIRTSRVAKKSTASMEFLAKPITVTRRQAALASKKEKLKFMENFNPETSAREKRKLDKKIYPQRKQPGQLNDSKGIHINTGIDLCDCMENACEGCFYHCKKCGSQKCGIECRVNRKFKYEHIEYHGFNFQTKNPLERM